MSLTMTNEEREAFLADVHVAVISVAEDGHGPLVVPIWYSYEPGGEVRIITGRTSRKGKLLERAGRFSLCVQTETLPYKYVSVEGPIVAVEAADLERDRRPLARLRADQQALEPVPIGFRPIGMNGLATLSLEAFLSGHDDPS